MNQKVRISIGREPFNGYSHLIASIAAVVGGCLLLSRDSDPSWLWYIRLAYAVTLFGAMFSSAAYHLVIGSPRLVETLREIDHWCIRGLIVGTFAPLAFEMLSFAWALAWVSALSLMTIVDAVLCASHRGHVRRGRVAFSYIVIASSTLIAVPFIWFEHSKLILWVTSGSLFYIVGAYCYLKKVPNHNKVLNFHEVWHLCVIAGAFVHYTAIFHTS